MARPKPLPANLGSRVPVITRYSGSVRAGYPWHCLRPLDWFVVPDHLRTAEMVRQAACRRAKRHGELFQTKLVSDGIMVIRLR
jgi:hypothetical protein